MTGPRSTVENFYDSVYYTWDNYPTGPPQEFPISGKATQSLTKTQGHGVHKLGHTNEDVGGEFRAVKRYYTASFPRVLVCADNVNPEAPGKHFVGPMFAEFSTVNDSSFQSVTAPSDASLLVAGTTAIARCLPTNPVSDLSTSFGELLHDGLPNLFGGTIWRDRAIGPRNAGEEYLNHQFGWLPLVSDMKKFIHSARKMRNIVRYYVNNSGKRIHRRYQFPDDIDTDINTATTQYPRPFLSTGFYGAGNSGRKTTTTVKKTERWFEGCFTYYLAPDLEGDQHEKRVEQLADKVYGARFTPETLWNLAPWSWAADWYTNQGDVIHNINRFNQDGLVMYYGYLMDRKSIKKSIQLTGVRLKSYPGEEFGFTQEFETVIKSRIRATPFGFGLTDAGMSLRQKAIAIALGITRGH